MMAAFPSPKPFPYGGMCQKRAAYRKSVLPMRAAVRMKQHLHCNCINSQDIRLTVYTLRKKKFPYGNFFSSVFGKARTQVVGKTKLFDSLIDGDIPSSSSDSESDIPVLLLTLTCEPDDTYRHQNI